MMIQGLSEENRFLPCLWPSNTLSLSRKSQIGIYVKSILIKLHGLVVQMSFIWDFEIVCKDEFSGSTTLFTWRQRFLLISNRGSPSLQHFCIMFFFEFAMPRKSWKWKGTSVSAEVKIRPKSCGYWKSKMEVASCCLSEPRSSLAFETFMKWLALRECSYACVGRVMSEEALSHQMGAVAEDASHINWCALIDTLLEKCQNVSEPCPWSSAVPIKELPLFLDELPAQCLARNRSWKPLGSPAETPRRKDPNDSWSIL